MSSFRKAVIRSLARSGALGNADLSIPIFKNFAWNFEYRDDYMENAPNLRRNWSTSSTGITYTFSSPRR
jgi:hypothetical protein